MAGKRTTGPAAQTASQVLKQRSAGSRQGTHVVRSSKTGQWIVRRNGRATSSHESRAAAVAAAKALAAGGRLIVHEDIDRRALSTPLDLLVGDIEFGEGMRTTLRVPDAVTDAAAVLADEIGTSKNDALVRLALAGARVVERAREVAETREARWQALLAQDVAANELPDPEEMRAASFTLRDSGE